MLVSEAGLRSSSMLQFAIQSTAGGARAGTLSFPLRKGGCCKILTPALLIYTKKGLPVHISPDILRSLAPAGASCLQLSALHFLENPDPSVVAGGGGLHQFLALQDYGMFVLGRDPLHFEAASSNTDKHAQFETAGGRRKVDVAQHMAMVQALQPDMFAPLADEVPAWSSAKRVRTSVDRNLKWLDGCLAAMKGTEGSVFGVVGGAGLAGERRRSSEETAKRAVAGFHVGGFGLGEEPEDRPVLLKSALEPLPAEKPRHISGLGMPEEVLQAVSAGVDLFDSTYVQQLTAGGYAMTFPLRGPGTDDEHSAHARGSSDGGASANLGMAAPHGRDAFDSPVGEPESAAGGGRVDPSAEELLAGEEAADRGEDHAKINLRFIGYRADKRPLLEGCECYTCRRHTRSYIHHLLNAHEMLAEVLLDIHNTHHYLGFFEAIRDAIRSGQFAHFKEAFIQRRRRMGG